MEDAILSGAFPQESQVPSTTEISGHLPDQSGHRAQGYGHADGRGRAVQETGFRYVCARRAPEQIREKRRRMFYETYIVSLLEEAGKLGIDKEELIRLIESGQSGE